MQLSINNLEKNNLAKNNVLNRAIVGIAALIWVSGLLAAGSDSVYMPWLNAGGALVFLGASLWLGRILPRLEVAGSVASPSMSVSRPVGRTVLGRSFLGRPTDKEKNVKKKNAGVNTRYTSGWSTV